MLLAGNDKKFALNHYRPERQDPNPTVATADTPLAWWSQTMLAHMSNMCSNDGAVHSPDMNLRRSSP